MAQGALKQTRKWKIIHRTAGYSQRYAMEDNDWRGGRGGCEVFVFDNSGRDPELTDDGPLSIDLREPLTVDDTTFTMRVTSERDGQPSWVSDTLDGLLPLLKALREHGLKASVVASKTAKAGARALVYLAHQDITEI
jgi:hypothetical protein